MMIFSFTGAFVRVDLDKPLGTYTFHLVKIFMWFHMDEPGLVANGGGQKEKISDF